MILNHIEEQVRQEEIFSRERTPTRVRVLGELIAGASYRGGAAVLSCAHEKLRDWYLRLEALFQSATAARPVIAVDETKVNINGRYVYFWTALDV